LNHEEIDEVISAPERIPTQARSAMKSAPSLRPGVQMMEACVMNHPEATSIRDAWAFRFPVRIVTAEEYRRMIENQVVFVG
jgi:hypothetical protein